MLIYFCVFIEKQNRAVITCHHKKQLFGPNILWKIHACDKKKKKGNET